MKRQTTDVIVSKKSKNDKAVTVMKIETYGSHMTELSNKITRGEVVLDVDTTKKLQQWSCDQPMSFVNYSSDESDENDSDNDTVSGNNPS